MNIPFIDLHFQYNKIKPEIDDAIKRVIKSQFFVLGPELEEFEKEFANYLGIKYAVGVNSGTDALVLSLLSLGIGKGDEVITPANSYIATTSAIIQVGATPVLVDCDKDTYQINTEELEEKISNKTKVIIPVHLYGAPARIDKIQEIAKKHKLYLIEDAAQAHGATYNNKKLGTFGNLGAFSFYPGKNLGAYGDAGAIVTDDNNLYEKLLKLRNHGQIKKYVHDSFGMNSRLDEMQAAILKVKLKYLDEWNNKRNLIASEYNNQLKDYKTQKIVEHGKSAYHLFIIENENRDELQRFLFENGIQTLIHYPIPIHLQEANKHLGYKKGDFPVAENLSEEILSIPIYPELFKIHKSCIINNLNEFDKQKMFNQILS